MANIFSKAVLNTIEHNRKQLLDLTSRNPSISYKNLGKTKQNIKHIRVIDCGLDSLHTAITNPNGLTIQGLSLPDLTPKDENTLEFRRILIARKKTDQIYLKDLESLEGTPNSAQLERLENELRDRIRIELGLPPCDRRQRPPRHIRARDLGLESDFDLQPNSSDAQKERNKSILRTLEYEDDLSAICKNIHKDEELEISEKGIETLSLALGFLEWYDIEHTEKANYSPLIFLPVSLEKTTNGKTEIYKVSAREDSEYHNLELKEILCTNHGIIIPELSDIVSEQSTEENDNNFRPTDYFKAVEKIISAKKNWKVHKFAIIASFKSTYIPMFRELEASGLGNILNPNTPLEKILSQSFDSSESESSNSSSSTESDSKTTTFDPTNDDIPLITNADASQIKALKRALNGENLVIEGPPGTGKSQTITNLIASLANQGKRILFVAEKQTALTVVKDRLNTANLEPFYLDLSAAKLSRKEVVSSIKKRLEYTADKGAKQRLDFLKKQQNSYTEEVNSYITSINSTFGNSTQTIHEIIWQYIRSLESIKTIENHRLDYDECILLSDKDTTDIEYLIGKLDEIQNRYLSRFKSLKDNPWTKLFKQTYYPFKKDELLSNLNEAKQHLSKLIHFEMAISSEHTIDIQFSGTRNKLVEIGNLKKYENIRLAWLKDYLSSQTNDPVKALRVLGESLAQKNTYEERLKNFFNYGEIPLFELDDLSNLIIKIDKNYDDTKTIETLREEFKQIELIIENTKAALSALNSFNAVVELTKNNDINTLRGHYELSKTTASKPPQYTDLSLSDLIPDSAFTNLQNLIRNLKELNVEFKELSSKFELSNTSRSELEENLAVLENSNFLSFLNSRYRRAKKYLGSRIHHESDREMINKIASKAIAFMKKIERIDTYNFQFMNNGKQPLWESSSQIQLLEENLQYFDKVRKLCFEFSWDESVLMQVLDLNTFNLGTYSAIGKNDFSFHDILPGTYNDDLNKRLTTYNYKSDTLKDLLTDLEPYNLKTDLKLSHLRQVLKLKSDLVSTTNKLDDQKSLFESTSEVSLDELHHSGHLDAGIKIIESFTNLEISSNKVKEILSQGLKAWLDKINTPTTEAIIAVNSILALPLYDRLIKELLELYKVSESSEIIFGCINNFDTYPHYVEFRAISDEISKKPTGTNTLKILLNTSFNASYKDVYNWLYIKTIVEHEFEMNPALRNQVGINVEKARNEFRRLDDMRLVQQQHALAFQLAQKPVPEGIRSTTKAKLTEMYLLRHIVTLTRHTNSVRQILIRAGASIQALKPIFIMSPLTVAQTLPPNIKFDTLIIDEASQLRPVEAFGSIARSAQVIVVGDPLQMPPASRYAKNISTDYDDDSENNEDKEFETITHESILDLMLAAIPKPTRLKWHYRSQHEGLIAFSNKHFYDNDLVCLPSAIRSDNNLGVKYKKVSGIYHPNQKANKLGMNKFKSTNPIEAEETVEIAVKLMAENPDSSMLIVAMNSAQSELIETKLEERIQSCPISSAYVARWSDQQEKLMIRNLENVQGDERDIVIISTVYGPDSSGNTYQRFGPINLDIGHRRLNVLFTRAKKIMYVVTSLDEQSIKIGPTTKQGVQVFRDFLRYARTNILDSESLIVSQREPGSYFERHVIEKLKQQFPDLSIIPQVGANGFFIDIGVKHPTKDTFILGIECDGATFHSSRFARDRDKTRQVILERMGWRIYRIWSTEWFADSEKEFGKLAQYISTLLERSKSA